MVANLLQLYPALGVKARPGIPSRDPTVEHLRKRDLQWTGIILCCNPHLTNAK